LPRLLRDRDGVVTSAYANVHALRDPGLLVLSATTRPARASTAVGKLVDHTLSLIDELDSEELDKARIAAESSFVRQLETAQGRARSLGWYATMTGDPQFGHVYLDRIRSVRRGDVGKVMQRYLQPHNASVAAVLPRKQSGKRQKDRGGAVFAREAENRVRRSLTKKPVAAAPAEKRTVLGNGTVLLVRRDPSVPVVAMRAVWRGGQRVEDAKTAGASTLLSRLITRGCGKLSAAQIADRVDRLGGGMSAVAGRNSFGISAEWLARSWKPGFELLADCILSPSLSSTELEAQRRLLLEDQVAQTGEPAQLAFRTFSEALYGSGHPYARDVLGTAQSVESFERDTLAAFYRQRYPTSALTLSIVGDVDVDEVIAAARARFDKGSGHGPEIVPKGDAKKLEASSFAARLAELDKRRPDQREVFQYLSRAQAHLVVGFPGATLDAPDRFALELLVAVLGGQGGRLFAELRDKRALVYRVSAHSIEGVDPGFVAVYLSCSPDKLGEAVSVVRDELTKIRTSGVTQAELDRAKSYAIGSHQIAMQRRAAVANAMAYHEAYGLGWESWSRYDDAIRKVTPADLVAAATKYLRDDRMITATVRSPIASPGAVQRSKIKQPPRAPVRDEPKKSKPTTPPQRIRPPRGNA
jgi:zinc protease